mgnify:CR=1 FL=1
MRGMAKRTMALTCTAMMFTAGCGQKATTTPASDISSTANEAADSKKESGDRPVAGMTCYMYSDTHIANVRNTVLGEAENGPVAVETSDSQFDVGLQMNAMDAFVTKGAKYLVINNINTNAKDQVIDVARKADIPIIFWNTDSPSDEEMESYGPCYFVSSAA